jgi:signal transduction histidine kinase
MRPSGYLARRWAAASPAEAAAPTARAAAGPALTTVHAVAARTACTVRCVVIGYIAVQVVIWHAFYVANPWLLAGPAAGALWASAVVVYLRRREPDWRVAVLDCAGCVLLGLVAQRCVPPAMQGDAASWLYIAMAGEILLPAWFAPTVLVTPLAGALGAAYWAGVLLTPGAAGGSSPAAEGVLMLALAAVAWSARWTLFRWAAGADEVVARADRESRAQYVILSRNIERREHERLLHDTVLNTLTALARAGSGDTAGIVGRCRHDVTLMEHALSDPGDSGDAGRRPYLGLLAGIEAIATEMRSRGLDVHLEVTGGAEAAAEGPGAAVPAPVAAAIAHAVREGLANVASHAGTGEAWVVVSLAGSGAMAEAPGGVEVTVRDQGAGFDPDRVDPARLGLRRSVVERLADWGGQASVSSAPGEGTVLSLRWTGPAGPAVAAGPAGRGAGSADLGAGSA